MPSLRGLFDNTRNFLTEIGVITPYTNNQAQVFQVGEGLTKEQLEPTRQKVAEYTGNTNYQIPRTPAPQIPRTPAPQITQAQNPTGLSPLGGGSTGATGAPSNAFAGGQVAGITTDDSYQDEQRRLQEAQAQREAQISSQASNIYTPLVQGFGAQLSRLPSELAELQGRISAGSDAGRGLVQSQLDQARNVLGQQEQNVRGETQKSLRSLAEDQRNTTTSLARQLGARGAGDTSAGDYAGAAIGRQGLKQRGSALESQATGLREIEGRRVEAQNLANQELSRIEQAKQQQLTSIASDFQNIQRQLESAKATASSQEQAYIAEQQNQLRDQLQNDLTRLENEARQRKAALQDWFVQQETQLQNNLRLISGTANIDLTNPYKQIEAASRLQSGGTYLSPQGAQELFSQVIPTTTGLYQSAPQKKDDDLGIAEGLLDEETQALLNYANNI